MSDPESFREVAKETTHKIAHLLQGTYFGQNVGEVEHVFLEALKQAFSDGRQAGLLEAAEIAKTSGKAVCEYCCIDIANLIKSRMKG